MHGSCGPPLTCYFRCSLYIVYVSSELLHIGFSAKMEHSGDQGWGDPVEEEEEEDEDDDDEIGFVKDERKKRAVSGSRSGGGGGRTSVARCQADSCNVDLNGARAYHRRHKVCEFHSKAAVVILAGLEQRFCQQCSR